MSTRLVSSSLWIGAGVLGIGTALVFRDEPVPWAITFALGILAVLAGIVLLVRTVPGVARCSTALGIAWVLCYAALAVWQLGDPAAVTTDIALALLGAGAAVVGRGAGGSNGVRGDSLPGRRSLRASAPTDAGQRVR